MAVVDERPATARPFSTPTAFSRPGSTAKRSTSQPIAAVDLADELADLALAADDLVVHLAGVLRVHALDPHGGGQRLHELALERVDPREHRVEETAVEAHALEPGDFELGRGRHRLVLARSPAAPAAAGRSSRI